MISDVRKNKERGGEEEEGYERDERERKGTIREQDRKWKRRKLSNRIAFDFRRREKRERRKETKGRRRGRRVREQETKRGRRRGGGE